VTRRRADPIRLAQLVFLGLALLFVLLPILLVVMNSFNNERYSVFPPPAFSLRWYANIPKVPNLGQAVRASFVIAVIVAVVTQVTAFLAAYGLVRYRSRGRDLLRAVFLSPFAVPRITFGVGAFILFLRLRAIGGIWPFVLVHTVLALPFAISVLSAGLLAVPVETEEAALDLGAHPLRVWAEVILPQLRTALIVSTVFSFVISWDQLDTSLFLARPGQTTLPVEMLFFTEQQQDPTLAALSTVLILLSFVLAVVATVVARPRELARMLLPARAAEHAERG